MSKIGVGLNIDVTKIEKARLVEGKKGTYLDMTVEGKKGTYLDMTVFIDLDEQDQYGNNGMIVHAKQKGEEGKTPILGNAKIFWREDGGSSAPVTQVDNNMDSFDDDSIPF